MVVVMVISCLIGISDFLWHWWKSNTLWKIWERVNQSSSFLLVVIEGAFLTEFAFSIFKHIFAWLCLIV